jgi:hypothetical protein
VNAPWLWTCDVCGKPVTSGGYVQADESAAREHVRAVKADRRERAAARDSGGTLTLADITVRAPVRWQAVHRRCDPGDIPDQHVYWIGVERLRTLRAVLSLGAHLSEKGWVRNGTDWSEFLARQSGGRISF